MVEAPAVLAAIFAQGAVAPPRHCLDPLHHFEQLDAVT